MGSRESENGDARALNQLQVERKYRFGRCRETTTIVFFSPSVVRAHLTCKAGIFSSLHPYADLVVDGQTPKRTTPARKTNTPKWEETFTLLENRKFREKKILN